MLLKKMLTNVIVTILPSNSLNIQNLSIKLKMSHLISSILFLKYITGKNIFSPKASYQFKIIAIVIPMSFATDNMKPPLHALQADLRYFSREHPTNLVQPRNSIRNSSFILFLLLTLDFSKIRLTL